MYLLSVYTGVSQSGKTLDMPQNIKVLYINSSEAYLDV